MLLQALGILVLSTGMAAAQATAAERAATRGQNRVLRADRTLDTARVPAGRASRAQTSNRDLLQADRTRAAAGQTPAERASGSLNRDTRADRFRDAARDARGDDRPIRPEVQQFESQRRTLQPDVGRPEQNGRISTEGMVGGLPSMGPNPQR
ncbi:MAG: hypothetical protein ICV73_25730 [Acetobacteraceae bacterium]|nr:hypothetical protein [Acetobacteraceae bacterium]